jgi:hypothetical protein
MSSSQVEIEPTYRLEPDLDKRYVLPIFLHFPLQHPR